MTFLVLAYDGVDADAPARRAAARPAHLATAQRLKTAGHFLVGGAILEEGSSKMVGSMLLMEFPTRAELDAWLASDAYSVGGVWKDVSVKPFRRAHFD